MNGRCIYRQENDAGHIEVWDDGDRRSLWFDDVILQSEIFLTDPAVLPNPANRAMLAHLMFVDTPRRVLLAGCGGGGIARWFHARSPETSGIAVERSADIVNLACTYFGFPRDSTRWRMLEDDIRNPHAVAGVEFDFILFDIEEEQYTPRWATEPMFIRQLSANLSNRGVLAMNLIVESEKHFAGALQQLRDEFNRRALCLPVPGHDNVIVFCFRENPDVSQVEHTLEVKAARWGLEFSRFLELFKANNPVGSGLF